MEWGNGRKGKGVDRELERLSGLDLSRGECPPHRVGDGEGGRG